MSGSAIKLALSRILAAALSWACPGLGQFYAGRSSRAVIALLLSCLVFMPMAVELPLYVAWNRWAVLGSMGFAVALLFVVPVDAAFCVRAASGAPPRALKRWLLGILFAVVGLTLYWSTPEWLRAHVPRRLSRVPSVGMLPGIQEGDSVIFERYSERSKPPARGEIFIFIAPGDPDNEFIKRVVGLPGDTIEVRDGNLIVDGTERAAARDDEAPASSGVETAGGRSYAVRVKGYDAIDCTDWGPARVPDGAYFLLGDNRCHSRDSRDWGAVPHDHLRGRVLRIQWSKDPATGNVRWPRLGIDLTER